MGYCKDPFGMSRQMSRANKTFNGIVRAGVRAAKAWEREATSSPPFMMHYAKMGQMNSPL